MAEKTLFRKVDYSLRTLLDYIEMGDIGLPDLQRPFVWSNTKVRDLLDSMYRGFPVGNLVFWETLTQNGARPIAQSAQRPLRPTSKNPSPHGGTRPGRGHGRRSGERRSPMSCA